MHTNRLKFIFSYIHINIYMPIYTRTCILDMCNLYTKFFLVCMYVFMYVHMYVGLC